MLIVISIFIFVKTLLSGMLIYSEYQKELLIKFLKNYDGPVTFVGEASSHCVCNSIKDIPQLLQKFTYPKFPINTTF